MTPSRYDKIYLSFAALTLFVKKEIGIMHLCYQITLKPYVTELIMTKSD